MSTLVSIAEGRGLIAHDEIDADGMSQRAYRLAVADVLMWLSNAPDVSQGGQSYSFTDDQRKHLRNTASSTYREANDAQKKNTTYGYKGSLL